MAKVYFAELPKIVQERFHGDSTKAATGQQASEDKQHRIVPDGANKETPDKRVAQSRTVANISNETKNADNHLRNFP